MQGLCSVPGLCSEETSGQDPGVVADTCNPSYLGGRDKEDHGSKPAWVKSLQDPISTNEPVVQLWGSTGRRVSVES
jgi:hypothetical protein